MASRRRAVLIAGPTASGKSALALALAQEHGGIIVNTDAMQVYDTLQVVTARPSAEEMTLADHRLYGTVPTATRFSTGQWLTAAADIISATSPDQLLIFVGGTGLYFDALVNGFADVPAVPPEFTAAIQQEVERLDGAQRLALLEREDPDAARMLKVADPQRLIRALAVKRATGRTLSSYQNATQTGLLRDFEIQRIVLDPNRQLLRERIARRFEAMFAEGAVEEVKALLALDLDPGLPAMKAIGVPEIADWLAGRSSREDAVRLATTATHQYAKRQGTWFRNRFGDWPRRN
ncbi:tRNA (adenosine(37)-N6)-dimethylallyltransferase MiaA [Devosia rhizosphaerae]|uniref:tRNA (adenosine(37)-N6)-dimethylallyltransferase MiaA n=1 Tax=Devosia rhizosphaerae TaxID=3049774 RepID=UPI0039F59213